MVRRRKSGEVTLRPGIVLPGVCYLAALGSITAGAIVVYVAHSGGSRAPLPPPGDWSDLGNRLIAGSVLGFAAWFFYQLGSQRIILSESDMEIVDWFMQWSVPRNGVKEVLLSPRSLTIRLSNGVAIVPLMFRTLPVGAALVSMGRFENFSSRKAVVKRINEWYSVSTDRMQSGGDVPIEPRMRINFTLLIILVAVMAVEAFVVTVLF